MRIQTRVRGLQDILNDRRDGRHGKLEILNRLAVLQREKERITQEQEIWQRRVDLIDNRLEEIAGAVKHLHRLVVADHASLDDQVDRREETDGVVADAELCVSGMMIQY